MAGHDLRAVSSVQVQLAGWLVAVAVVKAQVNCARRRQAFYGGWLGYDSLGEEPCATVAWSLQKPHGAVCKERNSHGAF